MSKADCLHTERAALEHPGTWRCLACKALIVEVPISHSCKNACPDCGEEMREVTDGIEVCPDCDFVPAPQEPHPEE